MEKHILKNFAKYVSLNVLGMIGLSCYILADTFFISWALGATGITALNFSISIYSIIHGSGLMIGIGGATKYSILKSQNENDRSDRIFTHCVGFGVILGIIFAFAGIFSPELLASYLGADVDTLPLTKTYLSTMLCFSPFFIMNNILLAFVRNDNNPNLPMAAMVVGSFSNILLDYIFMFPLSMGMFGAAFATGLAPIISMCVLSIHFIKSGNKFKLSRCKISAGNIYDIVKLGLSAFVTEVSSAIVLITFNLVILKLKGNIGVAAYGIVANIALVGISVFTGIAQGIQPLVSKGYGAGNAAMLKKVSRYAVVTSFAVAFIIYITTFSYSDNIIAVFNNENNNELAMLAKIGMRIYFIGFFFAGINIVAAAFLSAMEQAKAALFISILRGCIIVVPLVMILSKVFHMTGVWFAFVLTECIVTIVAALISRQNKGDDLVLSESL